MSFRPKSIIRKKNTDTSKCTLQEIQGKGLCLTTIEPKKSPRVKTVPPPQNPPQGEYLADEYINNLQQQLYFLDAELRFLKDRTGIDQKDVPSVDSAIRRLRRAMAMYEEETLKKINEIKNQTEIKKKEIEELNENEYLNKLEKSNNEEYLKLQDLESDFIDNISTKFLHKNQINFYDNFTNFLDLEKNKFLNYINQQNLNRDEIEKDSLIIKEKIIKTSDQRKLLLNQLKQSIESKRKKQEEKDILQIIGNEPELPSPNITLNAINSKNAKIKLDIQSLKKNKKEIKEQIFELLKKNSILNSEINIIKVKVERNKKIKEQMELKFEKSLNKKIIKNKKQLNQIEEIRKEKKEIKKKIIESSEKCNEFILKVNKLYSEIEYINDNINFQNQQKQIIIKNNENLKNEINLIKNNINNIRNNIDIITNKIAESNEIKSKLKKLIEINQNDPRYNKINTPNELNSLLNNLNAVKNQI